MTIAKPDALFTDFIRTFILVVATAIDDPQALFGRTTFFFIKSVAVHFPLALVHIVRATVFIFCPHGCTRIVEFPFTPFFVTTIFGGDLMTLQRGGGGGSCRGSGSRVSSWLGSCSSWLGSCSSWLGSCSGIGLGIVITIALAVRIITIVASIPTFAKVGIFIFTITTICWIISIADVIA